MNTTSRTTRSSIVATSGIGALLLLTACTDTSAPDAAPAPSASSSPQQSTPPSTSPTTPPWSYEGATGTEYWGELDTDAAACDTGNSQSPIDVAENSPVSGESITLDYTPSDLTAHNTAYTVELEAETPQSIEVDGTTYTLKQLHYHSPSEHTVDGESRQAEFHLVHQSQDGALAVVGVMVDAGQRNDAWQPLVDAISEAPDTETVEVKDMDLEALLPESLEHHAYDGSLTTPPCTENVRWLLLQDPVDLSTEQIQQLVSTHSDNNRPTQPLNERTLAPSQG